MAKLRASPSGELINGTPGQVLVCQGNGAGGIGNIWVPGTAGGSGGLVAIGWDQTREGIVFQEEVSIVEMQNGLGPLEVNLGAALDGQLLEVDFRGSIQGQTPTGGAESMRFFAGVSLDVETPVFPGDFEFLLNASAEISSNDPVGSGGAGSFDFAVTMLAAAPIPADTQNCIVRIGYTCTANSFFSAGGTDGKSPGSGIWLRAALYDASIVRQAGPGDFAPFA